jgi:hypothetical protein
MAENQDAEVDPRFDPVFQRGYDPKVHGERRPRTTPRHGTALVPIESVREPASRDAPAAAATVEPPTPDPSDAPVVDAEPDLALRARNPFRVALLIASIVSIFAATLMIWSRIGEDAYYGGFSGTDQLALFRSQLIAAAPVPLLTGGLLGLILWLAIGAVAHRARADE